jgi:hypothetical protein
MKSIVMTILAIMSTFKALKLKIDDISEKTEITESEVHEKERQLQGYLDQWTHAPSS